MKSSSVKLPKLFFFFFPLLSSPPLFFPLLSLQEYCFPAAKPGPRLPLSLSHIHVHMYIDVQPIYGIEVLSQSGSKLSNLLMYKTTGKNWPFYSIPCILDSSFSMCWVFSCVVGRGCLLWPVRSLGRTLLAFALLHSVLQGQICLLLQVFLDFLLLHCSPL